MPNVTTVHNLDVWDPNGPDYHLPLKSPLVLLLHIWAIARLRRLLPGHDMIESHSSRPGYTRLPAMLALCVRPT
jgi:hypothetical protein